jgi:hypothetical protein
VDGLDGDSVAGAAALRHDDADVPAAVAVAEGSISISCAANQNHMFLKRTSVAIDPDTKLICMHDSDSMILTAFPLW